MIINEILFVRADKIEKKLRLLHIRIEQILTQREIDISSGHKHQK